MGIRNIKRRLSYGSEQLFEDLNRGRPVGLIVAEHYLNSKGTGVCMKRLLKDFERLRQQGRGLYRINFRALAQDGNLRDVHGYELMEARSKIKEAALPLLLGVDLYQSDRPEDKRIVDAIRLHLHRDEFNDPKADPESHRELLARLTPLREGQLSPGNIVETMQCIWSLRAVDEVQLQRFTHRFPSLDRALLLKALACLATFSYDSSDYGELMGALRRAPDDATRGAFLGMIPSLGELSLGHRLSERAIRRHIFLRLVNSEVSPEGRMEALAHFFKCLSWSSGDGVIQGFLIDVALEASIRADAEALARQLGEGLAHLCRKDQLKDIRALMESIHRFESMGVPPESRTEMLVEMLRVFAESSDPAGRVHGVRILMPILDTQHPLDLLKQIPNGDYMALTLQDFEDIWRSLGQFQRNASALDVLRLLHLHRSQDMAGGNHQWIHRVALDRLKSDICSGRDIRAQAMLRESFQNFPPHIYLNIFQAYVQGELSAEMVRALSLMQVFPRPESLQLPLFNDDGGIRGSVQVEDAGAIAAICETCHQGLFFHDQVAFLDMVARVLDRRQGQPCALSERELVFFIRQLPMAQRDALSQLLSRFKQPILTVLCDLMGEAYRLEGRTLERLCAFLPFARLNELLRQLPPYGLGARQALIEAVLEFLEGKDSEFSKGYEKLLCSKTTVDEGTRAGCYEGLETLVAFLEAERVEVAPIHQSLRRSQCTQHTWECDQRLEAAQYLQSRYIGSQAGILQQLRRFPGAMVVELAALIVSLGDSQERAHQEDEMRLYTLLAPWPYWGGTAGSRSRCEAFQELVGQLRLDPDRQALLHDRAEVAAWLARSEAEARDGKHPLAVHRKLQTPECLVRQSMIQEHRGWQWNIEALRSLPWETRTQDDLPPGIGQETLEELLSGIPDRFSQGANSGLKREMEALLGCSLDLAIRQLGCSWVQTLLAEGESAGQEISSACYFFYKLLDQFHRDHYQQQAGGGQLADFEIGLLKLGAALTTCDVGKADALERFFVATFGGAACTKGQKGPGYRRLAQGLMEGLYTAFTNPEIHERLTGHQTDQGSHFTLYLRNRLARHLGAPHAYSYDVYSHYIPNEALEMSTAELLNVLLGVYNPERAVFDLVRMGQTALEGPDSAAIGQDWLRLITEKWKQGDGLQGHLGRCFKIRYQGQPLVYRNETIQAGDVIPAFKAWESDDYEGDYDEPPCALTQKGACCLLRALGWAGLIQGAGHHEE